jgi:hypothetical protein
MKNRQWRSVQSIIGATENLLTTGFAGVARTSAGFVCIYQTLICCRLPLLLLVSEGRLLKFSKPRQAGSKTTGTITVRKRKDGSAAYTAQIRITRKGATVYQESRTSERKAAAQCWLSKCESGLGGRWSWADTGLSTSTAMLEMMRAYRYFSPPGYIRRSRCK